MKKKDFAKTNEIIIMKNKISYADKIFIAGARGMAGSSIYRIFRESGYGKKEYGGEILSPSKSKLNLLNQTEVNTWFKIHRPSVVIIAAAKVGGIIANSTKSADFLLENIKIQTNIIESAWRFDCKRLLFLGSSCIYPKYSEQPIKEEYLLNGSLEITNECYAIAKITGIKLCESLRHQYGFDAISLMPTNLYGPGDNYHPENSHVMASLLMKFINAKRNSLKKVTCWGTGSPLREFMHVDDLSKAVLFALEKWDPKDKHAPVDNRNKPLSYLNVGSGDEISIKDLASKIASYVNYEGEILWDSSKPDGTPRKRLDNEKIFSLGWRPTIKLDDGIKNTIKNLI